MTQVGLVNIVFFIGIVTSFFLADQLLSNIGWYAQHKTLAGARDLEHLEFKVIEPHKVAAALFFVGELGTLVRHT